MANTIRLRRGSGAPTAGSFVEGEPAWDSTNGVLYVKNAAGTMVQVGGGSSGGTYTVSATAPSSPASGDRWLDTDDGIEYTYFNDGNSSQWVETGAPGVGPAGTGDVIAANSNAFSGANTFTNATGQSFRQAATQDGILLRGRAGGNTSRSVELVPAPLSASRVLTAPDVDGTIITTADTGTVTSTMIADGAITNTDINASAAIAGTKISPDFGSQNITTTGTITGDLTPSAGTATVPPLDFTAGTNVTVPIAGAVEYDGTYFFATPSTTPGRGQLTVMQTFRLAANGSNVGSTIGDFFGANSAINLAATSVYDVEFWAYFQKNTAGTITWTLTASSAPTVMTSMMFGSPVSGIAAGTPITNFTGSRGATTAVHTTTGNATANAYLAFRFKTHVVTNAATTYKLQITQSAGTVTPQAGSYYTVKQICSTTGSFA